MSHFLERKVFKDAGGVKLSRRSASTSGQSVRIAQGDLAVMTYTDIENEATAKKRDPGKMIVRAEKSETGVILGHKLSRSSGPLVNIAGAHGKKLRSGEWMGLDVESVAEAPFLIHHITRSYEECKEKDAWTADRQGTWRHKMPVSVCDQRNASSTHYRSEDYMKQPNVVCRGLQSKRKELCEEMRRLHPSRCDEVSCCEG